METLVYFPGMCVYKGVSYKQGQKWKDACQYNCECIDAQRGQYKCTDRYIYWSHFSMMKT